MRCKDCKYWQKETLTLGVCGAHVLSPNKDMVILSNLSEPGAAVHTRAGFGCIEFVGAGEGPSLEARVARLEWWADSGISVVRPPRLKDWEQR